MSRTISLKAASAKVNLYKCPECPKKFTNTAGLHKHVAEDHGGVIPDEVSVKQYIFNRKYKKSHGKCVVCPKKTKWNEEKGRYERYCSDACVKKAREEFRRNCMRRLGTDNPASTPEHQMNAIKGRSYSGEYTYSDGGIIGYSSSYELDFLIFCDETLKFPSSEVMQCDIIFNFEYEGSERFHIPDFYLPVYNLIVNIKTFQNGNSNIQGTAKDRQKLSDKAIVDNGSYNYIMILDKEYTDLVSVLKIIKDRSMSSNNDTGEKIVSIPKY